MPQAATPSSLELASSRAPLLKPSNPLNGDALVDRRLQMLKGGRTRGRSDEEIRQRGSRHFVVLHFARSSGYFRAFSATLAAIAEATSTRAELAKFRQWMMTSASSTSTSARLASKTATSSASSRIHRKSSWSSAASIAIAAARFYVRAVELSPCALISEVPEDLAKGVDGWVLRHG